MLVLSIINVSLIAFREADLDAYSPAFRAPGYPVVQILGTVVGFGMITQLGLVAVLGAAGITVGGAVIYLLYGQSRASHDSALAALRGDVDDDTSVISTEDAQ
jgi:APA family basic amino acid/polyamine antiporter